MENLIKFLEDKITDKMSVEEIVDVFEQMCSTPLEEDMVLFETGTITAFSKEPFFQISLVRQFSNDDEEFYQIHVVILYKPTVADGLFCREIDGLFCRSSPDSVVRRRCVLSLPSCFVI